GLAISLAFQGLLSDVAGGLSILITKPFVVGNFVEISCRYGHVVSVTYCVGGEEANNCCEE
ncbi:MAG: mechanosensitive ion channel, partial [Prevotella sp.]|nr:mechanosensitive ion channel [Prevotella sp.]